jgi:Zinc finger found in FPG and IleRS
VKRLHAAVRAILEEAIALKGSSVSDYVGADGQRGEFQMRHRVYQREGEKCFRCRTEIRRVIIAGRSSHFCPTCQPVPRSKGRTSKSKKPAKRSRQRLKVKTQAASRSLSRAKNQKRSRQS